MSNRKVGALLSYANTLARIGINFLFIPILIKYIGKDGYGIYNLILSLMGYFALMDLGLNISVIRFYARLKALKKSDEVAGFLHLIRQVYLVIVAIVIVAGAIFYLWLNPIFGANLLTAQLEVLHNVYIILLLNTAITLLGTMYQAVINGNEHFLVAKSLIFIQLILQPLLAILVFQLWPTAEAYALIILGLNVLLVLSYVVYTIKNLDTKIYKWKLEKELKVEIIKLALSCFVVLIADQVFFRTNQIILGIIVGTSAVAIYAVAATIYMNYMSLSAAMNGVFLPKISSMVAAEVSPKELSDLFIRIGRLQFSLLGLILFGFILFGHEFISIWVGRDFEGAYAIALIIMVPFTIDLIQNIGLIILQALNKYHVRAIVFIILSIVNIFLAIPLAYKWQGFGCAIATGLAMFVGNGLIMNYYYWKHIQLDIFRFWKNIMSLLVGCIPPLVVSLFIKYFIPVTSLRYFLLEGFIFAIVYVGSLWLISFNAYEKDLLHKAIRKFR